MRCLTSTGTQDGRDPATGPHPREVCLSSFENAVGAAIAQINGEVDGVFTLAEITRIDVVGAATAEATTRTITVWWAR